MGIGGRRSRSRQRDLHRGWRATLRPAERDLPRIGQSQRNRRDRTRPLRRIQRDPEGLFTAEVIGSYQSTVDQPVGAADTSYTNGKAKLWIDPDDTSAIFMEVDDHFERWPRFNVAMGCD